MKKARTGVTVRAVLLFDLAQLPAMVPGEPGPVTATPTAVDAGARCGANTAGHLVHVLADTVTLGVGAFWSNGLV